MDAIWQRQSSSNVPKSRKMETFTEVFPPLTQLTLLGRTNKEPNCGGNVLAQPSAAIGGSLKVSPEMFEAQTALERLKDMLDLSNVRMKLADSEEGPALDKKQLDLMEGEYRKFLAMQLMHPDAVIVPCKIVDEMWHRHILDTAAYRNDCEAIFGRFLDHYPYFGMRNEAEAQELFDAYADTLDRYRAAFGEPPAGSWVADNGVARCRRQCAPMKCR